MKIKLVDVVNSEETLSKLLETKLPIKTSYWLSKLVLKMAPELQLFREKRGQLFKELGEPKEDNPNTLEIKPENLEKFNEELRKILDVEIEFDVSKFTIEDFGDIQTEPNTIINLSYLFNE